MTLIWAIRGGKIERPSTCTACGNPGVIQAHHPDYSAPLQVLWLCRECHRKLHAPAVVAPAEFPAGSLNALASALGRLGGKAGTGEAKRRGDSAYYRAIRRRDYVADRRHYLTDGRRDYTTEGWMVMRWDAGAECYREGACFRTKREALEVLRDDRS